MGLPLPRHQWPCVQAYFQVIPAMGGPVQRDRPAGLTG